LIVEETTMPPTQAVTHGPMCGSMDRQLLRF
jgi:hypothetical protein